MISSCTPLKYGENRKTEETNINNPAQVQYRLKLIQQFQYADQISHHDPPLQMTISRNMSESIELKGDFKEIPKTAVIFSFTASHESRAFRV